MTSTAGPGRAAGGAGGPAPGAFPEDLLAFHHDCFLFDGHNDLALRVLAGEDPSARLEGGHLDVPRMRAGGFDGGVFAVWTPPPEAGRPDRVLGRVRRLVAWLEATAGVRHVRRAGDLRRAEEAGEVAAVVGVEGGYAIGDDPGAADALFDAGVRCLTLTWTRSTPWADAAGEAPTHGGLTEFGARLVRRLQELGVAVDVSHASDDTVRDVLDAAVAPVTASHSALRSLCDIPRNLPEELLEEIGAAGGVTGVNFYPGYLADGGRAPGLERLARHLERAIEVAGPGAVGLGSDFDGVPALPEGMDDAADLPRLTVALASRGIPRSTLRGVLGDSYRRFFEEVLP